VSPSDPGLLFLDIAVKASIISSDVISESHIFLSILRSKAIWATEGDKNTKYFLNLEKYKQETNSVKELFNKNGLILIKHLHHMQH
jgi:hypothetical protein